MSSNLTGTPVQNTKTVVIPKEILDDLASRFLINLPPEEKTNIVRLFFMIEQAHWFYLDFYCTQSDKLIPCGIKQFALNILSHIPSFKKLVSEIDSLMEQWIAYKMAVPTFGAILLTEDLKFVLLVQSFFAKNSWGFPKGKVNELEDPIKCAIREVEEETGFDCSNLINANDYVEHTLNYQYAKLYIVRGVPFGTKFEPKTRNEIKECSWFRVDDLPSSKYDDPVIKDSRKIRANSFYMVLPFIKNLKKWIYENKNRNVKGNGKNSNRKSKGTSSPFFNNNVNDPNRNRPRHKSLGDEYYNYLTNNHDLGSGQKQLQFTSTPVNQIALQHHQSSPFRVASNDNSNANSNKSNKKKNRTQIYQEHIKRKLFSEIKEMNNISNPNTTIPGIKPFSLNYNDENAIPVIWKNFKFDKEKLMALIN